MLREVLRELSPALPRIKAIRSHDTASRHRTSSPRRIAARNRRGTCGTQSESSFPASGRNEEVHETGLEFRERCASPAFPPRRRRRRNAFLQEKTTSLVCALLRCVRSSSISRGWQLRPRGDPAYCFRQRDEGVPRSPGGTAPPSSCQSNYLSQAHTQQPQKRVPASRQPDFIPSG